MTRKQLYCYYIYKWKDQQRRDSKEKKFLKQKQDFYAREKMKEGKLNGTLFHLEILENHVLNQEKFEI